MHLINGLETTWSQTFPVSCNSAFRVHICLIGPFLLLLCSTGLPWVKYRLLMIVVQGYNLYKCTICTKREKRKSLGPWCFSMMGEVIQSHSLFQSIQQQGVGSVVWHIQGQLPQPAAWILLWPWIEKHLQWPQATQNVNRCRQSAVLSSDPPHY